MIPESFSTLYELEEVDCVTLVKECFSHRLDKLIIKSEYKQAKSKRLPSSRSFCLGCHQKGPYTFRVGLPVSKNQSITKIPHWSAQQLMFKMI